MTERQAHAKTPSPVYTTMTSLPAELVSAVLAHVEAQDDLTRCARVSKLFVEEAARFLYRTLKQSQVYEVGTRLDCIMSSKSS